MLIGLLMLIAPGVVFLFTPLPSNLRLLECAPHSSLFAEPGLDIVS